MQLILLLITLILSCSSLLAQNKNAPNIILVMTDDQGIGDLSCHGNPYLKTPNIDKFYQESVRMTNFHVSPLCTPTRAALMTGQYPINNGAWATFKEGTRSQREYLRWLVFSKIMVIEQGFLANGI